MNTVEKVIGRLIQLVGLADIGRQEKSVPNLQEVDTSWQQGSRSGTDSSVDRTAASLDNARPRTRIRRLTSGR